MRGIAKYGGFLVFALVFLLSLSLTGLPAQEKTKVAIHSEMEYTSREVKEIGDLEGHTLILSTIEGINKSTGDREFMDGAKVTIFGFTDAVKGNGISQGYVNMVKDGNIVYGEYKGKVTTTMVEGKPVTVFETTGKFLKGSGIYKGIQGEFTSKTKMVTEKKMVIETEGEYSIK